MAMYDSYAQAINACPTVKLDAYAALHGVTAQLAGYLNFGGITGSYNDALAAGMLSIAEENGALQAHAPIVEASSGAFATALAHACRIAGRRLYLVVPMGLAAERYAYLDSLGARLIMSESSRFSQHKAALEIVAREGAYFVNYFENDFNPEFHRRVTGPAIMQAMGNNIDAIVIGVASGGTISGVGESVKAYLPDVKIVAVEPYESQAIGGGIIGRHSIAGMGAGFVPENYNERIVDKVVAVTSASAHAAARELAHTQGLPCDSGGGAVACAAAELALANAGLRRIVCVMPARVSV